MAGISNYLENAVLDAVYGQGYTKPATIYVALTTVAVTAGMTGSTITEPNPSTEYGAYARVAVTNNATNWPNASSGQKSNGLLIQFPTSTGGVSSPAVVIGWATLDAASAGNLLNFGVVNPASSISLGTIPEIAPGVLLNGVS